MEAIANEKRISRRVQIPGALVRYKLLDSVYKAMYMEESPDPLRNISSGGVSFTTASEIAIKSHLRIDLQISPDHEPIRAFGKVHWIRKDDQEDVYHLGVSFSWWKQGEDGKKLVEQAVAARAA